MSNSARLLEDEMNARPAYEPIEEPPGFEVRRPARDSSEFIGAFPFVTERRESGAEAPQSKGFRPDTNAMGAR
jgi:hypothetical protein